MNKSACNVVLMLLLLLVKVNAQQADCKWSLHGQVIDDHDGKPLPFAGIYIYETGQGAYSDSLGKYRMENLCTGSYTVRCTHIGCDSVLVKLNIKGNTRKDFRPEHHELHQVTVEAERIKDRPTQALSVLPAREMEQVKGQSLGESLKRIAGVNSIQTGSSISKPVIHGMHSNRILILNNGVRQEGQQWGSEHAPEVDPFIADQLSVIKGANSVRYGSDAMAGVILVEPRALPDTTGVRGEMNLVGLSNGRQGVVSGIAEGSFNKAEAFKWRLQGTLKKGGNVRTPDYFLKNTGVEEKNFSISMGVLKHRYGVEVFYSQFNTKIGIFSGSHIGNLTDLQRAFERAEPAEVSEFSYTIDRPFQNVEHELLKVSSYLETGHFGKVKFIYSRQYNHRQEYDKHRPRISASGEELPDLSYEITTHTGDVIWEHYTINSFSGSIGANIMTQANTYEGRFFIPNYQNQAQGVFAIERWKKKKLEVEAGMRYDKKDLDVFKRLTDNSIYSASRNFNRLSGSIGALYSFTDYLKLSSSLGTAWRAPAVNELYSNGLHHGAASIEVGDETLNVETAYNFISSINYKKEKKLNAEVSFYYNTINNFIYLVPKLPPTLTVKGAFPTFRHEQTDAVFKGFDVFAEYYFIPVLSLQTKASLLRAVDISNKQHLVMMPADRYENTLTYFFKTIQKMSETYFSLTTINVLKQWRVPLEADFASPPPAYFLMRLDIGTKVKTGNQLIEIGMSVNNLFDTKYRDYLDRFRYFADAPGRSINFRIKVPIVVKS